MADLIPQGGMQPQPQGQDAGASGPDPVGNAQQQADMIPADQQQGGPPRPVGTAEDAQNQLIDQDPTAPVEATPDEQGQYEQLVTRFMLMISDPRKSHDKGVSPADSVLKDMNRPNMPLAKAIGRTGANVISILTNAAKHMGVKYDPDVIFHATDECLTLLYIMGKAAGIFHGVPQFDPQNPGELTKKEMEMLGDAKMFAAEQYGNHLLATGQLSKSESADFSNFWKKQVGREVAQGTVPDNVLQQLQHNDTMQRMQDQIGQSMSGGAGGDQQQPQQQQPAPAGMGG